MKRTNVVLAMILVGFALLTVYVFLPHEGAQKETPPAGPIPAGPALAEVPEATKLRVQAVSRKLPLHFEANQGQTDSQVKFLSRGRGYTLFLTPTEAVLALRKPQEKTSAVSRKTPQPVHPGRRQERATPRSSCP